MENHIQWNLHFQNFDVRQHFQFNCNRCGTKNSHGLIRALYRLESQHEKEQPYIEEVFKVIQCSTCSGFSINYELYEPKIELIKAIAKSPNAPDFKFSLELTKNLFYPINILLQDFPEKIKDDYNLMHSCYQIGSAAGVAVHCRRILDKIFFEFEEKFVDTSDIHSADNFKERAKKISEKCPYFKTLNEDIKNLKGSVSAIVHMDMEKIIKEKMVIVEKDFENLNELVTAFAKVYELEFKIFPQIRNNQ